MPVDPQSPYPVGLDVAPGTDYYRRYAIASDELMVQFAVGVSPAEIADVMSGARLEGRVDLEEMRYRPLLSAGMRWVRWVPTHEPADDEFRALARGLVQAFPGVVLDATPVFVPEASDVSEAAFPVPRDVLVEVAPGYLGRVGRDIIRAGFLPRPRASTYLQGRQYLFRLPQGQLGDDGFDLIYDVREISGVESVEFDWVQVETFHQPFPKGPPDEKRWTEQWNLRQIGMAEAWKITDGKAGEPVAIIDSGFDLGHPGLAFEVATRGRRLDADALWRTDKVSGDAGPTASPHGTPMAGILAGRVNAGGEFAGMAAGQLGPGQDPAAGTVPIRLGPMPSAGRVAAALGWARKMTLRIASLSLSTVATKFLIDEIAACCAPPPGPDMILCAAAGNAVGAAGPERVGFPARHVEVIGVGASDRDDVRNVTRDDPVFGTWQSRFGAGLDVVAPGIECWSADERGAGSGFEAGDWVRIAGTSVATPHVAGLASLLLRHRPGRSKAQIRLNIERTCARANQYPEASFIEHPERPGANAAMWNPEVGCGRVDVASALERADDPAVQDPPVLAEEPYDPCELEDQVVLTGFVGAGPRPGTSWRLYQSRSLDRWIEFDEADVIEHQPIAGAAGGRRFWIRRGAPLRRHQQHDHQAAAPR